ncbi:MAG: DEAD/DEAH box helicase [Planctomycetes bacterium]|nr:DEAD/DEAH box helicase [Planctomycetota bacterium]
MGRKAVSSRLDAVPRSATMVGSLYMQVLHANWVGAALHLWGLRSEEPATPVGVDDLLRSLGDVWDSLLVSAARPARLTLRLPAAQAAPVDMAMAAVGPGSDATSDAAPVGRPAQVQPRLVACDIPSAAFPPDDAFDLLTALPTYEREGLRFGASLRYWSSTAGLVRELLAKQRFVPALHRAAEDEYRGYWRVVVDDRSTSDRIGSLIASMPPVCRSFASDGPPVQASSLVENFLWTVVDAMVRRCLEGDELAHALQERSEHTAPPQIRWLRSLVHSEPTLGGAEEECRRTFELVQRWLGRMEPPPATRGCRTCFRLQTAADDVPATDGAGKVAWQLLLYLQAADDPSLVIDARDLQSRPSADPEILKRPFDNAYEQLRADVAAAARHFPPLAPCADAGGPLECVLSLEEAYRFLRDAAPVLEAEGFGVWLPPWWRADRPRPRMFLEVRPLDGAGGTSGAAMRLDTLIGYDWRVALGDDALSVEEISALAAAKEPLVRLRGRWIEAQPAEAQAALQFLRTRGTGRITLLEALRLSYTVDDFDTGIPVMGMRATGWIDKLLSASDHDTRIEPAPTPAGFVGELRPYQRRGLDWLAFLARHGLGACLADDMGLGKTVQLIAMLLHERETGQARGPTLIVVPMSLVGNWQRELARFAPPLRVMVHHGLERLSGPNFVEEAGRHDVVISTYGLTHRDLEHLAQVDWHRVALDEAQNIKNPAAKQAVAVRSLRAVHRAALTGTPVENRLSELWSIMDFLNPGYLGAAADFRRRFAIPIERHHDADRGQRLRHLIRPFVLRRLKGDPNIQLDLPDKLEMTVFCNLTREQAALYEAVVQDMLAQIDVAGGIQRRGLILATLVKLKQICNHPAQFLRDSSALPQRSGKCSRLTEMLEEVVAEDHRALIFTQFREMGHLLQKHLQEALSRPILFLHGGTPQKSRDLLVEQFQSGADETRLLILSLKAGGVGLNLTAANHVFHFDRWWNPAVEDQATDRSHRIGQDKQVQVHKFVCIGTLEERIAGIIEQKRALARNIIGSGEEWITELSTDALRELFVLSRDAVAEE